MTVPGPKRHVTETSPDFFKKEFHCSFSPEFEVFSVKIVFGIIFEEIYFPISRQSEKQVKKKTNKKFSSTKFSELSNKNKGSQSLAGASYFAKLATAPKKDRN